MCRSNFPSNRARSGRCLRGLTLLATLWLGPIIGASAQSIELARSAVVPPEPIKIIGAGIETQESDIKFQATYVWQRKSGFQATYSGANSLLPEPERRSYSLTATAFMGTRVWDRGELYFNPEMSAGQPLSGLHGLGAMTNGENQKGSGPDPKFYRARLFVRHTWNLGGGSEQLDSAPNQLAGSVDRNRMVLTAGNVSLIDIFDNNTYSHDPRSQFLDWTIMTHGAFDYASDARGYTTGAALEYYLDNLVFRIGRFMQPRESNGLALDTRLFRHYGDQVEIERGHEIFGQPGKLRLLGFRNRAIMGGFQDALDVWRAGGSIGVPDIGAVRRERAKLGWGISLEQAITGNVGMFLRASSNDGKSETFAFTEVDRSFSGGFSIRGTEWGRASDAFGIAFVRNDIASSRREYLANGGLGPFIGDGLPPVGMSYRYAPEQVFEAYYNANIARRFWASVDLQRAQNPAYNAGRGPVNFLAVRLHVDF